MNAILLAFAENRAAMLCLPLSPPVHWAGEMWKARVFIEHAPSAQARSQARRPFLRVSSSASLLLLSTLISTLETQSWSPSRSFSPHLATTGPEHRQWISRWLSQSP